jgi:PHS family inorganic phosphate transporter-like MFS transporter
VNTFEDPHPREQSLRDFRQFFWVEGNWTDLFATAANWALLDFVFYLLGVNSATIIPHIFNSTADQGPFPTLFQNEWHTLVATSIGAIVGGVVAIKITNNFSRKKIQMWSFLVLAALFVAVGVLYVMLLDTSGSIAIVLAYVLVQGFFNLGRCSVGSAASAVANPTPGPNTTTFIVSTLLELRNPSF